MAPRCKDQSAVLVRQTGLAPAWDVLLITGIPPAPKAGASANFATAAHVKGREMLRKHLARPFRFLVCSFNFGFRRQHLRDASKESCYAFRFPCSELLHIDPNADVKAN